MRGGVLLLEEVEEAMFLDSAVLALEALEEEVIAICLLLLMH